MIANFFIMAESFANNNNLSNDLIEEKIKRLSEDIAIIHKYKETNKLYTNYQDLFPQIFYSTYTVQDFICNPKELKEQGVDRDTINAMQKILEKSSETEYNSKEIIDEILNWNSSEECYGIIAFNRIESLDDNLQVVYGVDSWYKFRRYYLSAYPRDQIYFIDECAKYFPNLIFHDRNKTTVNVLLRNCSKKIVYHLTALHDLFRNSQKNGLNRSQVLEAFSIDAKLDEKASLEGNVARKATLTFKFINNLNEEEDVCCEPHLKLSRNDNYPGDNSYSNDRRIYFHEGKPNIQHGKILIGHIGDHL